MRGISITEFGGPEVLKVIGNLKKPNISAKQVLINVKSCGVNPVDTYIRTGTFAIKPNLPYTPGKDGAGIIAEIGQDVTKFQEKGTSQDVDVKNQPGDRVWFFGSSTGSSAEYCVCAEENVGILPNSHDFNAGAMIGTPYLTAYRALFQKGRAKAGETVLIHGATGGVGTAAVQMCLSQNINIIATAGSTDGKTLLQNLGVTHIYDHKTTDYVEKMRSNHKIDVIIEMLANVNLQYDLEMIPPNGRIVIVGNRGPIEINPRLILAKEATVVGCMLFSTTAAEKEEQLNFIAGGLEKLWLKPVLWKVFPLEKAEDAHREIIENSGAKGQMVLSME